MRAAALFAFLALAAGCFAQAPGPQTPQIRGVLQERGSSTGIPGVEVTLWQFGPDEQNFIRRQAKATTFSGPDGAFTFENAPLGMYFVSFKKDGYQTANREYSGELSAERPRQEFTLTLVRPGSLTGRVVDEDGNPVPMLTLRVLQATTPDVINPVDLRNDIQTDAEGIFTASDLTPGQYALRVMPQWSFREELLPYSEAEFEIVDQNFESLYWPGGVADAAQVLPVSVEAGGIANLGTITARKVPYYRARIRYDGQCGDRERWQMRVQPAEVDETNSLGLADQFGGCRNDFLLTGLTPGEHKLVLWSGREVTSWAVTPLSIASRNIEARLVVEPSATIQARFRMASGEALPELNGRLITPGSNALLITIASVDQLPARPSLGRPDREGRFEIGPIAGRDLRMYVNLPDPGLYVKEILYGGLPLTSFAFQFAAGAPLEIVLERGAASVSGRFPEDVQGASVMLVREGIDPPGVAQYQPWSFIGQSASILSGEVRKSTGTFNVGSIPPGEYRVLWLNPREEISTSAGSLRDRLARAEKITLKANESRELSVKP